MLRDISSRLGSIRDEIETVKDEEEEAYYNLPDSIQGGDRGYQMQDNVNDLQEVIDAIENDVIDKIDAIAAC